MKLISPAFVALAAALAVLSAPLAQAAPTTTAQASNSSSSTGLTKLTKIVLFMQENRSFDHYFGTMAGVRGFKDPNVHISKNTGKPVFHQPVNATLMKAGQGPPAGVTELLPWYFNSNRTNDMTNCATAGSNSWAANHGAYNGGEIDQWAIKNTPYSMAYYKRQDIPLHFALAEGWAVGDAYSESVIASTQPNRVSWMSGSINVPGGKQSTDAGGPTIDNSGTPGCETEAHGSTHSCYPLHWKTVPEYLEDAGISWQVYSNEDDFGDNSLPAFAQYQNAAPTSNLYQRGLTHIGLDRFVSDAAQGRLPQVSIIIGPADLSEHPPYGPLDGAWLQRKIVEAVVTGKDWNTTALLISYDETGGFADHVIAPLSPPGTPGEWFPTDPLTSSLGPAPAGPGFRLPFTVISPYTRGGIVFSEPSSHESQILFLEKWSAAIGRPWQTAEMSDWRRAHMSDLTRILDFGRMDVSVPSLPVIRKASQDLSGNYNGAAVCMQKYGSVQPAIPYGNQTEATALATETGFKIQRGQLFEGHYLVFESNSTALTSSSTTLTLSPTTPTHNPPSQRWIIHAQSSLPDSRTFTLQSSFSGTYLGSNLSMTSTASDASVFEISDVVVGGEGGKRGYVFVEVGSGKVVSVQGGQVGLVVPAGNGTAMSVPGSLFAAFSVTY
ncbi:hypothetical protein CF327_g2990 [Tilletia walkeri]|nr:hypothetical protein CF327_g2990 [Tilletia walkeri]